MRRALASMLLLVAFLLSFAGSASAFVDYDSKNRVGDFGDPFAPQAGLTDPLALELHQENTILCYDPATGVLVYVRQNPWTSFDPLGLASVSFGDGEMSSSTVSEENEEEGDEELPEDGATVSFGEFNPGTTKFSRAAARPKPVDSAKVAKRAAEEYVGQIIISEMPMEAKAKALSRAGEMAKENGYVEAGRYLHNNALAIKDTGPTRKAAGAVAMAVDLAAIPLPPVLTVAKTANKGLRFISATSNAPISGGKKPIIVGENMKRVQQYADDVGGHAYRPWKNDPFDFDLGMKRNQRWIKDQMRDGRQIIDIGPDFQRRAATGRNSPFYEMERRNLNGYDNYRKVFERNGQTGGVPGLDK